MGLVIYKEVFVRQGNLKLYFKFRALQRGTHLLYSNYDGTSGILFRKLAKEEFFVDRQRHLLDK